MKKNFIRPIFFATFSLMSVTAMASVPTSNPFADRYPDDYPAWTDDLAWTRSVVITDYEKDADGFWDAAIKEAMADVAGGGTVFFPAGEYLFKDNVEILDGVILRGDTPEFTDARVNNFAPPSRLVFPKYIPTFEGEGTPNSTAFKQIVTAKDASNIALVYLDINRATINLGNGASTNVLALGLRSNNTATPAWDIPDAKKGHAAWQRFSWAFGKNMGVYGDERVAVVGCRCNDTTDNTIHPIEDDSYDQPGYVALGKFRFKDGDPNFPEGANRANLNDGLQESDTTHIANGAWARFNYLDHYGIRVSGKEVNPATITDPDYDQQILVLDNWVLTTCRVGYFTEGLGLTVRGNVKKDLPEKRAFLHPLGDQLNANNSATYENRGFNFAGSKILIENNDVQVERHHIMYSPWMSVDGEGILIQWQDPWGFNNGSGDGSQCYMYDVVIRNNRLNAYIGFWDIQIPHSHVEIYDNDLQDKAQIIYLKRENSHRIDYVDIHDNRGVTGIDLVNGEGPINGCNLYVRNNQGHGTITAGHTVIVEDNDPLFEVKRRYSDGFTLFECELFPFNKDPKVESLDKIEVRYNLPVELATNQPEVVVEGANTGRVNVTGVSIQNGNLIINTNHKPTDAYELFTVTVPAETVKADSYFNKALTWQFTLMPKGGAAVEEIEADADSELSASYANGVLTVANASTDDSRIVIYSVDGSLVAERELPASSIATYSLNLAPGVYVISNGSCASKFAVK